MEQYSKVRYWIEDLPKKGKIVFSQKEVEKQFPHLSLNSIRSSLYRLVAKKKIQSVWHGFFVIVPIEYGLKGIVAPIEYIDHLMKYLGKEYYISLLSAAVLQGAAHQQPMEFYVMTNSDNLRDKKKDDVKINFTVKKNIPSKYLTQLMTNSGYVNISIPELTAFDLILYAKKIGGINRVATVLSELAETMNFEKLEIDFFKMFSAATIQRLGYLLDLLGFENLANVLEQRAKQTGILFKKYPLMAIREDVELSDYKTNKKWKIIINIEIETDDL
jgi:predicted transcriptional regulator of viral defense system